MRKGQNHTIQSKIKISEKHKGSHHTEETKERIRNQMLGHITTKKTKEKISQTQKTNWKIGKQKITKSQFKKGKNHPNYIDGRSYDYAPNRYGDDWDNIRQLVYRRDNFTCQECGKKNMKLDVHHIIPFLDGGSNELDNLISLCRSCHSKITIREKRSYS